MEAEEYKREAAKALVRVAKRCNDHTYKKTRGKALYEAAKEYVAAYHEARWVRENEKEK